jgi:predicted MFS family arabinose efflux permease
VSADENARVEPVRPKVTRPPGVQRYLYLATAFWGVSIGLLSATLPFRFLQLGLPIFQYGVTLSVYAAGTMITEGLWGALAFRLGRPPVIVAIGAVVAGATILLAFATTLSAFLVAEVILGAVGVYLIPLLRWVALSYGGPGSEGAGTGRWSAALGLGLAVGVSVGPLAFVTFGFRDVAFASIAMLTVAVTASAALPWSRTSLPHSTRERRPSVRSLATPPFVLALGLVAIAFTAMTLTMNFLQYYSIVLFGGTPSEAGYVLGAGRLVTLAASFVLGILVDRWGTGRAIPAGFLLLLIGGLATWGSRSYVEMIGATLVFSAGVGWLFASILPLALDNMLRDQQGTAIGVFGMFEDAGLLIGPLLFGAVWTAFGPRSIFPVVIALAVVGVVGSLWAPVRSPSRTAAPGVPDAVTHDHD